MKKLLAIFILIFANFVFATPIDWSPSQYKEIQAIDTRLDTLEANGGITEAQLAAPATDGLNAKRVARVTYAPADDGGATGTAYSLGVSLPANSLITQVMAHLPEEVKAGDSNTFALGCAGFAAGNDLGASTDYNLFATDDTIILKEASQDIFLSSACAIQAQVGDNENGTATDGTVVFFIEYLVSE